MRTAMLAVAAALMVGAAAGQTPDGALLAGACAGCHGASGAGGHGIPSIQRTHSREQFVEMMRAFRADERQNTVMGRITRGYTEGEIAALAGHFARAQ